MSQAELAKAAGLSRQMVVLIESGASNPSIATLAEIGRVLGVTLSELVDSRGAVHSRLIPAEEFKQLWSGENGSNGLLVVASSAGVSAELWLWSIAPGVTYQATGEKAEEYALLLEGELELRFSDRLLTVLPGNAIALPLQQAYSLTAKGSVAARFVLMFVPA